MRLMIALLAAVVLHAQPSQLPPSGSTGSGISACSTTPPTAGIAGSTCRDTAGFLWVCNTTAPTNCTITANWVQQGGYPWTRVGTTISPVNPGDSVAIPTTLPGSLPTTTGPSGVLVPVLISSGAGPISPTATGFYFNNHGALTYNLPTITSATVGLQMCFRNDTGISGALTIVAPASTTIDVAGAVNSTPGNLSSGGALGDAACVVAQSTTQYVAYTGSGAWSNN